MDETCDLGGVISQLALSQIVKVEKESCGLGIGSGSGDFGSISNRVIVFDGYLLNMVVRKDAADYGRGQQSDIHN
jgi:hypothetical protein